MSQSLPAVRKRRTLLFTLRLLWFPVISHIFFFLGRILPFLLTNPAPPRPPSQRVRDVSGKNAIVTGANSGVGLGITKGLLRRGATVTMACRSASRAEKARQAIIDELSSSSADEASKQKTRQDIESRLRVASIDTARFASVHDFVKTYEAEHPGQQVDLLYLNAGIAAPTAKDEPLTEDGYELTYQTNFLSHFLLLYLLRNTLAPDARIISTSSLAAIVGTNYAPDFSTTAVRGQVDYGFHCAPVSRLLRRFVKDEYWLDWTGYGHTKAMQLLMSRALNERAATTPTSSSSTKRIALAFHPGLVSSGFFRTSHILRRITLVQVAAKLQILFGLTPDEAARTPVFLGVATPEALQRAGPWRVPAQEAYSRLWERSRTYVTAVDALNPERFWVRWCADAGIPTDWSI